MKKVLYFLSVVSCFLSFNAEAQSPTSPAQGFNVFTLNGATLLTNETEGPVAIGGNLTLASSGSYQVSTNQTGNFQVNGVTITLLIGGKVIYSGGNGISVNSNGYVKIGDSTNSYIWYTDNNNAFSPIRITPGNNYNGSPRINLQIAANNAVFGANPASASNNPIFQSNLINFSAAFSTMQASSLSIKSCSDNASITDANGNAIAHTNLPTQVKITLNTGINTLNLTGADMNNVQNFTYNNTPDATHILVINVNAPGTFNWSAWTNGGVSQTNCPYILYNFFNTTTLNIQGNGAIEGTVFAPFANITKSANQANIEGQIIGLSYYHSGGENHYANFTPTVTGCSTISSTGTCPSIFHRNNGNGQASSCPGTSSSNPEANSVVGTHYDYDSLSIGSLSKTGDIQFNFAIATGPGFEPAIRTIWDATSALNTIAGPPAPFGTFASNHRSSYCFYTTNLPPANRLTVEFVNPANSQTYAVCSYDNQGNSINPPTINTQPSNQSSCIGGSATFSVSASPVYGGTLSYQWRKNGINISGATSNSYTINNVANSDTGNYDVLINESNGAMTSSNVATLSIASSITPSVSIAANPGTSICSGTSETFTATPTNGGTTPSYQWKKNGVNVGTNSNTYTNNSLVNGDIITCVMTSNASCASPATATSNSLTMSVTPSVTPSITISGNTVICAGTSVTFTATPTNGGASPSYQWKKNGNSVGANSTSYTDNGLNNGDQITCVMTSNATCASPATATSNILTMTVNNNVTPSISISGNTTTCAGTSVTFTATTTNGGTTPSYQWKKNGTNAGTNSATYTDNGLNNGDQLTCVVTSNAACASPATATSNTLTMTVNPLPSQPAAFTASSATTYQGQIGVTYTVPNVSGVTYSWSYSGTGATINGSGNSVTVDFSTSATSGSLCVTATTTSGCGPSASRCMPVTVNPYLTWTCGTNNDWNTASNWDGGFVPYGTISVLIPSGPCQPSVCSANANVYNLTINNGATVNICCSYKVNVNNNLTLNGSVTGCGYLSVTGTSCHTIYGKGKVDNFELNNSCGGIINSGDTLHIVKTYKPTLGVMTVNGELELLSDSSNTAVILTHPGTCSNYINGDVICDKYIHGGRRAFRFIGHPFTSSIGLNQLTPYMDITGQGGAANGFTTTNTNNPSAFWYNTLTGNGSSTNDSTGWIPFTNTNGLGANAWKQFEGIRLFFRGSIGQGLGCTACVPDPITIKMHGPINECDEVVTLQTNTNVGYNLISNPYPSNIDLSLSARGSAVGANFAVWDPNQGVYGAYVSQPFSFSYILPSMSAFVTTSSSNSNNTITFHESDKTASAASGTLFKTTSGFGNNVVQLHILSNNDSVSWDRLLLFFNGQAMSAVDNLDNQKIYNPGLSFYTYSTDNTQLSIDVRPYVNSQVIQLGLQNADPMDYSIRVDDYDVPAGATLYLHDKYLNQVQTLSKGMHYNFSVTSDPASQGDNRFELNFSGTTLVSNVLSNNYFKVNMMPNPATESATVSFEAPQAGNTIVRVSAITGQEVYSKAIGEQQNGKVILPLQNFAPGMYIVTIICGNYSLTQRLIKQ